MKKLIICCLCACMLSGCSLNEYSKDISHLELIQTIGVDKNNEGVYVTAAGALDEQGSNPMVISAGSSSISGALERLDNYSSREKIYLAHTKHYILGEQAAREGVGKYLDYIERDMNMRMVTSMYIVKDGSSGDMIKSIGEDGTDITKVLNKMIKTANLFSDGYVFSCGDVAGNLAETGCSLVAAIELASDLSKTAVPAGYGVIKDGKLISYIDTDMLAGVNIFIKNMNPDIHQIKYENGNSVAFRISVSDCDFEPIFQDGEIIRIDAKVLLDASVDEVAGYIDISDQDVISTMEDAISAQIKEKGDEILRMSQEMDADFLKIGKKVYIKNPVKFKKMSREWKEVYSELNIDLSVDTRIERTYDIINPIEVNGELYDK